MGTCAGIWLICTQASTYAHAHIITQNFRLLNGLLWVKNVTSITGPTPQQLWINQWNVSTTQNRWLKKKKKDFFVALLAIGYSKWHTAVNAYNRVYFTTKLLLSHVHCPTREQQCTWPDTVSPDNHIPSTYLKKKVNGSEIRWRGSPVMFPPRPIQQYHQECLK